MSRSLTDEDIKAISNQLTSYSGLTAEEHRLHHETFTLWISKQTKRMEFWDKVQAQVGGWFIVVTIMGLGYMAWDGFLWVIHGSNFK